MRSSGEAFSNQPIGWCCVDRLSRHELSRQLELLSEILYLPDILGVAGFRYGQ